VFPVLCSGVNAVSSSAKASCIYSGGADGMVCQIDPHSGNLIRKFKASTKTVSSLCVSPDGKILVTASTQLKTFNCSDLKKIQKFTGHPVSTCTVCQHYFLSTRFYC
jgi:U3 small nucleolar RNA-associated protein 5